MADKYYRLVCFVVNLCPEPLREFFIKLASKDVGTSYTTVDAYLAQRHVDVMQLKKTKRIEDDQYDLLYPCHGSTDVDQWDVTLLVTLITEMFATSLQPLDIFIMKNEIRGIRNELQYLPNTSNMTDKDFDIYWGRLDTATMAIAKQVFSAEREEKFRKKIENAKCSNLPNLGDSLSQWYDRIIKQMQSRLNEIESNTKETISVLRSVTVQKPGPTGEKNKRIKTADRILAKLQAGFETTMKELPESFNAPSEVVRIRTKLRDHHSVVVTGSYNSRYFETALEAIRGMDYNYKRSVELVNSSDWRHIDPEDVDLVFCRNPFGSFSYDENKSKSMADIFNSMKITTEGDGYKTLDIIMVTDSQILEECKQFHDHDILENVIKVFEDTSETHPVDLTIECGNQDMYSTYLPLSKNLKDMTSNFLKQYRICSGQVDEEILRNARQIFKAKKAVVLTGPKKCGKTSLAVALASSYDPSHCILLTEPNDFKKMDFQNTCLVIIDEFTGKYCYDEKEVYKWYSMFDHLYYTVKAGKMNAIITCEKSKLDKCCEEVSLHHLLEHRVNIPERTIAIKREMVLQDTEKNLDHLMESCHTKGYNQYHKQFDDSLTASVVEKLSIIMGSVGVLISCGNLLGTVFRAGEKYVLTAYHVIQSISERCRIRNKETFVNFNESPLTHAGVVFQLEKLVFFDKRLNVAVLEVSNPKELPIKMKLDKQDHDEQDVDRVSVIGFGHPCHHKKTLEPGCALIDPDSWSIICTKNWLREKNTFHKNVLKTIGHNSDIVDIGLGDIRDFNFVVKSFMEQSVSGAPAIAAFGDGSMNVTGLITHGIPELYYLMPKVIRSNTSEFPCEHRYAVGTKMKAIYLSISESDPQLLNALFR